VRYRSSTFLACGILAFAGFAGGCGLDRNGLDEPSVDGSSIASSTPVGDATASFPDGGSGTPPPGPDGSTAGTDATIPDDATTPDAPDDAPPSLHDANIPDVGQPDVHVLDPDASYDDAGDPCDLDQDGYRSMEGTCGGNDCCDYDSRANPGDTNFYTSTDACGSFDYNCNGKNDEKYAKASCSLDGLGCTADGFADSPPACGVTATFDTCNYAVAFCYSSTSQAVQACN
jgi:hypothetical protein